VGSSFGEIGENSKKYMDVGIFSTTTEKNNYKHKLIMRMILFTF
jgi:hypothetical protein